MGSDPFFSIGSAMPESEVSDVDEERPVSSTESDPILEKMLPTCAAALKWRVNLILPAHMLARFLISLLISAAEAKSDLVNVLSSLEAHWHVLEAEVMEINRDIEYCEQCLRKYGEWFNSPLQYLRVMCTES